MFPAAFDYRAARSIEDALSVLDRYGADARVLAGGQSLIPAMRFRLARPAVLVDINTVPALDYINESDGHLLIGAIARDFALEHAVLIAERYPLLADTSAVVADPVVRQMGTVLGSLCHNDPAGDWPVAALAARAEVVVRGPKISRVVPIDDFVVDSFTTAVGEGEMAVEVRFPTHVPRSSGAYFKLERKVGDFATASAAVQITLAQDGTIAGAGVAIGAVGAKALRVAQAEQQLLGARPSADLIAAAVDAAKKTADPVADTRGSAEFKREMAGVLVGRALRKSLERLRVGGLQ
ncbi:MAG: FAD binding domain-containing protein [Vulcanimicrobiaceae bacterium]